MEKVSKSGHFELMKTKEKSSKGILKKTGDKGRANSFGRMVANTKADGYRISSTEKVDILIAKGK